MKFFSQGFTFFFIWFGCSQLGYANEWGFQIVVNPANPITDIEQKFLAEIFLKKKIFWPNHHTIEAVDLDSYSSTRREFSEKVLDKPTSAVRIYWHQLLYSGRNVPPPEFKNEKEVHEFVATHQDAIGYISNRADLKDLKVISIK